jgi:predicted anti-sigma-YlaC factor YlaD
MYKGRFQKIKQAFILWLARRLPDCKRMTRSLGESLDREMSMLEKLVIKLHLFTCDACRRYLEQIAFTKTAVHEHGERDSEAFKFSAATLSEDSKARLKSILRRNTGLAF